MCISQNVRSSEIRRTNLTIIPLLQLAQKVWIALETVGDPYDMEEISLYGPGGKPDWFMKLNPKGTVPVLVCGGGAVRLRDSDEILDKVGDAIPGGSKLIPHKHEDLIKEFRSRLNEFLPIGKKAVLGGNKDKMWAKLSELDALIEGPYICGGDVTVADCAAFPFLWRIENEYGALLLEKNGCKNIQAWLTTCERNEAFSTTIQSAWWWWW